MIKECKSREAFLEILTKGVIYRELEVGALIPAPHPKDPSKIEYYKVEKKSLLQKAL